MENNTDEENQDQSYMEPLDLESQAKEEVDPVHKLMSQLININEEQVLHEPTCTICSSPILEEIEEKYENTGSYEDVADFYKEKTGKKIKISVLENHFQFHTSKKEIREIQKKEYMNRVKRCSSQNLTTLERISLSFSIITERLMAINSITPTHDESVAQIEKIKTSETTRLMTAYSQLLKMQAQIMGEMKSSGEMISIPANEFINVINETLAETNTDREREIVKKILHKLDAISRKTQ